MLDPSSRLGSYEIIGLLGKGGMGEVYRAQDTKLGRDVAVKVLPEVFAQDVDRIARFKREAKVLASLNHSNIATLYGMEEFGGKHFLVMELVEGETLAERIRRGPLPVNDAIKIAAQIADALEAAHEKGVIHRDLKPANVKITPDDKVKVLDFGLAKAMDSPAANSILSNSPTLSAAATNAGVILGTAAYMSPEQAKGLEADVRSDTFSFGCVLYEMLSGRQAFQGESISEILASVLVREPDYSVLPPNLNQRVLDLLRRCFEKNPRRRWHAVGDLRIEIEKLLSDPSSAVVLPQPVFKERPGWKRAITPAVAAVLAAIVTGLVIWGLKPALPVSSVIRFPLVLPADQVFTVSPLRVIAISRDGTKLAYAANNQLYLRQMSDMEARPIPGTTGSSHGPVFSPDGQWLAFFSLQDTSYKKIAITGGAALTIFKTSSADLDLSWQGDHLIFVEAGKGIMRVSDGGGEPEVLVSVPPPDNAFSPQIIDDGKAVLYTLAGSASGQAFDQAQIVVQPLPSGPRKVILRGGSDARYVPTGHIIYSFGGNVRAIPFDLKKLEPKGSPVGILEGVMRNLVSITPDTHLAFSDNGALVYVAGNGAVADRRLLAFADKAGKIEPLPLTPEPYLHPRFSPDGKQLVFQIEDPKGDIVSVYPISGDSAPRRLTFGGRNTIPIWSQNSRYVIFSSDREGGRFALFRQLADGSGMAERLTKPDDAAIAHFAQAAHPNGKTVAFLAARGTAEGGIMMVDLDGEHKITPVVQVPNSIQPHADFSPDGRWLAYMSTELNGMGQIFVQPYPPTGAKYQVTTDGGVFPMWSQDGKQLFFQNNGGVFIAVDFHGEPAPSFGKPQPLPLNGIVQGVIAFRNFDRSPDGKRWVVIVPDSAAGTSANRSRPPSQINVVLNWFEELKQRVPVR